MKFIHFFIYFVHLLLLFLNEISRRTLLNAYFIQKRLILFKMLNNAHSE